MTPTPQHVTPCKSSLAERLSGRLGLLLALAIVWCAGCSTASSLPDQVTPIIPPAQPTLASPTPAGQPQPVQTAPGDPPPNEPLASGQALIVGQLTNGSAGANAPDGLPVTLCALTTDLETVLFTRTAQTDANARVFFEDMAAAPTLLYTLVANYQQVTYFSPPQHFSPGQVSLTLPITVYEPTSNPAVIQVDHMHLILDAQPPSLEVSQLWVVSNLSDRVYVNDDGTSLHMTLPPSASGLGFQEGEWGGRYLPTQDGFADTQAVWPGERSYQLLFSYRLPYDGVALEFALPLAYGARSVNVLLPEGDIALSSAQLVQAGVRQTQDIAYTHFANDQPLLPGQTLSFRLTSSPSAAAGGATEPASSWAWAIGGALTIGLATWLAWRRWRQTEASHTSSQPALGLDLEKDALVEAIARLDDAYQAGQMPEETYRRQREQLKAQLIALMSS